MLHLYATNSEARGTAYGTMPPSGDETPAPRRLSRDTDTRLRLPEALPAGETLLWQGAPRTGLVARHVLRIRLVAGYFLAAAVFQAGTDLVAGAGIKTAAGSALGIGAAAALALALLALFAWLLARSTFYAITDRRVVLRFGIALPVTLNLPLATIRTADLRTYGDGSGGIALGLTEPQRVPYVILWPHARPWRLGAPQPMLRAVPEIGTVAAILAQALRQAQGCRHALRLVAGDPARAPAPEAA